MASSGLGASGSCFPWQPRGRHASSLRGLVKVAAAAAAGSGKASYFQKVQGLKGPLTASATSGVLSATGDLLAQAIGYKSAESDGRTLPAYDPLRTLRMFGFGALIYGPLQYYWYALLEHLMPVKTASTFLCKLASNQFVLGPIAVSTVLTWNTALSRSLADVPAKLKADFVPAVQNGWKFWVPAASVNFLVVPLAKQVLYMSCCSVLWVAYLSHTASAGASAAAPAAAAVKPCCAGKAKGKAPAVKV